MAAALPNVADVEETGPIAGARMLGDRALISFIHAGAQAALLRYVAGINETGPFAEAGAGSNVARVVRTGINADAGGLWTRQQERWQEKNRGQTEQHDDVRDR